MAINIMTLLKLEMLIEVSKIFSDEEEAELHSFICPACPNHGGCEAERGWQKDLLLMEIKRRGNGKDSI